MIKYGVLESILENAMFYANSVRSLLKSGILHKSSTGITSLTSIVKVSFESVWQYSDSLPFLLAKYLGRKNL